MKEFEAVREHICSHMCDYCQGRGSTPTTTAHDACDARRAVPVWAGPAATGTADGGGVRRNAQWVHKVAGEGERGVCWGVFHIKH